MLNIKKLNNKKIAILGLGLENLALVKYLLQHKIKCEITVCDARENIREKIKGTGLRVKPAMTGLHWRLGKGYDKNLDKFDILFRSPGWPLDKLGAGPLRKTSSPMKLFFELCPTKNIIGVTGTKGKGTTASLIYEILRAAGKCVWLGGNIGVAPFEFMDKIKKKDWVVLELSSFQLEDMTISPRIAVITNFYSEHLAPADPNNPNYHKSLKDYRDAKLNIIKWQGSGNTAVLNYELPASLASEALRARRITNYELNTKAKKIYFKKSELPSKLIGEHNKENIAAAVEAAKIIGIKSNIIKKAVANFKGLEHRLELVREYQGVKYYDDSFATTPESTIIALKSFSGSAVISSVSEKSLQGGNKKYRGFLPAVEMTNRHIVLLLGGADKGANFGQLAKEIKKRCKFVVLLADKATPRIKKDLQKAGFSENKMKLVNNIKDAVAVARQQANYGEVILLSTACASFGMFKNYKERGNLFKAEVKSLPQLNNFASGKISARRYLTGLK